MMLIVVDWNDVNARTRLDITWFKYRSRGVLEKLPGHE